MRKSGGTFHEKPLLLMPITVSRHPRTEITGSASVITHARNNQLDFKETVFLVFLLGWR